MKKVLLVLSVFLVISLSGCDELESTTVVKQSQEQTSSVIVSQTQSGEDYYTKEEVDELLSDYNELLIMVLFDDSDDYEFEITEDGLIKETKISTGKTEFFTKEDFMNQVYEEAQEYEETSTIDDIKEFNFDLGLIINRNDNEDGSYTYLVKLLSDDTEGNIDSCNLFSVNEQVLIVEYEENESMLIDLD